MLDLETFVINLNSIANSENSHLPNVLKKGYTITKKKEIVLNDEKVIFQLTNNYNATGIRFGDFSFREKSLFENGSILTFALSSYSFLGIDTSISNNEEIYEYDRISFNPMEPVALNGESFLKAILAYVELSSIRFGMKEGDNKIQVINNYVSKCIDLAGGEKYVNFYNKIIKGYI